MKRAMAVLTGTLLILQSASLALQRSELSPLAQALIPEGKGVVLVLKDDRRVEGIVTQEDELKYVLRIQRTETISMSRTVLKADVKAVETLDVTPLLAEKIKAIQLNPAQSLELTAYQRAIALMGEFLDKCKTAPNVEAVRAQLKDFAVEYLKAKRGLEKLEGEWLTPVRAAVRKFEITTRTIAELEKRPDASTNEKVKAEIQRLIEHRREVARSLPKVMQDRVPETIARGDFDEAVSETVAFLHFWIGQVFDSEGAAAHVFKQMDFDYILRLQQQVLDAYIKAGKGKDAYQGASLPVDMVYVPGGYSLMGRRAATPTDDTFPLHLVFVSPFFIDKYEVSNADYRKFLEHVKATGDSSMEHPLAPPLKKHEPEAWKDPSLTNDALPVLGVDWFDAYAYSKFVGKRLPTETEWERAAASADNRLFPWGAKDPSQCAINWLEGRSFIANEMDRQHPPEPPQPEKAPGCSCRKSGPPPAPQPTRIPDRPWDTKAQLPPKAEKARIDEFFEWTEAYPSPFGVIHMAGNAAEWVYDWYDTKYYGVSPVNDPQGPESGKVHVIRGGSYLARVPEELECSRRFYPGKEYRENGCLSDGKPVVGFRCAKSLDIARPESLEEALKAVDIDLILKEVRAEMAK
ncbi:MAG: hypothetical protein A2498_00975 [Lentisphaerae bacterium RIFOXYC12_FULL_60_16]|nr:MAG: hypothetical protein A2498_00975 [Lentisphaerae bacterium RIFOXYC12_FULL_60_16]OGV74176.1 MAG: hypothetical protein A2269_08945 [Lentisphaerae bacterium RIFOXYA12_FULL_60_10]OGV74827.1 MAG: hypothetical protein A2340_13145 [Lentisphaerae bacterium RIFOXYB12_FULL_60_10]